jgi:hypothetical protein
MASIQLEGQQAKVGNEIAVADPKHHFSYTLIQHCTFKPLGWSEVSIFLRPRRFNKGVSAAG